MAASKKPSAGPCPPSDTRYSRGESDNSGSSTEIDSDKEIAASNFGNEGKEKAVPDAFQYPLRTSEAKKTVNLEEHDKRTQQRREIKSSGINSKKITSQEARSYTIHISNDLQYGQVVAGIARGAGKAHGLGGVGNG